MGCANNAEIIDEEDDDSVPTITNVVGNMQMASNAQSQAVREDVTERAARLDSCAQRSVRAIRGADLNISP